MSRLIEKAPSRIVRPVLLSLVAALAVGCAAQGPGEQPAQNNDFEIRSMIAADRQTMQSIEVRLRRVENQIQEMQHNGGARASNAGPGAPGASRASAGAPPAPASPPAAPGPLAGASPMAPPGSAPPAVPGATGEDAMAPTPPYGAAGVPPAGMMAPPANATGSAVAPGSEEGSAPPSMEEGTAEAGTAEGTPPEGAENAAPAGSEAAPAMGGGAENAPAEEEGETIASLPPAPAPAPAAETAPAEEAAPSPPPARWPHDLNSELQTAAADKGGAGSAYRSGLDAMKNRNYASAVEHFGVIQKKYPRSDLAEPAEYFSASALNEMGKYDQAILQYNDLVMRYPKGKYASEALLREAQAFLQINDKIDARLTLQKLLSEHAHSPQASTANAMMKSLVTD